MGIRAVEGAVLAIVIIMIPSPYIGKDHSEQDLHIIRGKLWIVHIPLDNGALCVTLNIHHFCVCFALL